MAAEQVNISMSRQSVSPGYRLLGTLGMIGSAMLFIETVIFGLLFKEAAPDNRVVGVSGLLYLGGWACSAIGMRQLRATGGGGLSRIIFIIQLTGLLLAALFNVQEMVRSNPNSLLFKITDAAWPLSHLFMLVTGAFVLKAQVWRGWRRLTPLLCGLALPAFFAASAIVGGETAGIIFGIFTMVAFMLLGYAVRTSHGPIGEA